MTTSQKTTVNNKPDYVVKLETWRNDGTSANLDRALRERTPVRILRSSGEFVTGIIAGWGHAGLTQVVAWGENLDGVVWDVGGDRVLCPEGALCKRVSTEDLLAWNPSLLGDDRIQRGVE